MTLFRVWASKPQSVELQLNGQRHPMQRDERGWWSAQVPAAQPGADYAFVLDGSDPRPDPRSPWQPQGVHGPSRLVDHAAFPWSDSGFQARPLASAIIYELHVGTFTPAGTFESAIDCLDHLVALGITHVELLPVVEFPGSRGWGYDGVDLFAPHHAYGGPEGLKRLIDACHARGLAVILDVVYNHLGPDGNYLGQYGPYFTTRYQTPWGEAVNLDGPGSDEVRRFFIENALMWLRDYHCDGLRLDAVHAIHDESALHFLEELALAVHALSGQLGRHFVLIAESDLNDPRLVRPRAAGGFGLDAQWSDDFHHALHSALTGERSGYYRDFGFLADLATALRHAYVYAGRYSAFRERRHGRPALSLPGEHFLGYLQNHDQIGNRAQGERSSHLLSPGLLHVAAALVLTAPFVPILFQGEEWGASSPFQFFTDHQDPQLARSVSEGRRKEFAFFGWQPEQVPDPQAPETFERSKLHWGERSQAHHAALLTWHRALIQLRRSHPALVPGPLEGVAVDYDETARWLSLRRGNLRILCNFASQPQRWPLPPGTSRLLLASSPDATLSPGSLTLPSESVAIVEISTSPSPNT